MDIGALELNSKRRKYRAQFGVNIGSSVSPETFEEIEKLSRKFGIPKAQVVRRLYFAVLPSTVETARSPLWSIWIAGAVARCLMSRRQMDRRQNYNMS